MASQASAPSLLDTPALILLKAQMESQNRRFPERKCIVEGLQGVNRQSLSLVREYGGLAAARRIWL
jgi:hypothetical protein